MSARDRRKLTDAAVARLRPREREYAVWDRSMAGFGVRVRPTGAKTFILLEEVGGRTKRISLGPVSTMAVADARRACHERRARPGMAEADIPVRAVPPLRDFVEGEWKAAHFHRYKPATRRGMRYVLEGRILPAFGSKPLDRIAPAEVRKWFDARSRAAPGGANPKFPGHEDGNRLIL